MGKFNTKIIMNWTKQELVAYILLFAANSDLTESNKEREIISSKIDEKAFKAIHEEFNNDNDYQSIQKIVDGLQAHNYSKNDLDELFSDIKSLFFADGDFDILEQNMLRGLQRILK